jgi:hypothetical protein
MPNFSNRSKTKLKEADLRLQKILEKAIEIVDFTVLTGHRGKEEQNKAYEGGFSKLRYPKSKHNSNPSLAVDITPFPIDFKNTRAFYYLAGVVKAIAYNMNIQVTWGGDWDGDDDFRDNKFNDLVHYELDNDTDN